MERIEISQKMLISAAILRLAVPSREPPAFANLGVYFDDLVSFIVKGPAEAIPPGVEFSCCEVGPSVTFSCFLFFVWFIVSLIHSLFPCSVLFRSTVSLNQYILQLRVCNNGNLPSS